MGKYLKLSNLIRKSIPLVVAFFAVIVISSYTENMNTALSGSLIRLHIVANSDSPEDQELKRDVRDAVLKYIRNAVKDSENIEQTRKIIEERIPEITAIAQSTVNSRGYGYKATTSIGEYPFPTKAYGDITLPAGNYQAVKVVLGEGSGANWWCVLFPPLCFVDVTHGTVPDSVKEDLKKVLSEEEYKIVTSSDEDSDIPIKIKFKIVEVLQDSKIKLASAIEKLLSLN
jgi:stage II sporulation protein R